MRRKVAYLSLPVLISLVGCVSAPPYMGKGAHPQIERGRYVPVMDEIAGGLAFFEKIILLNPRVMNHSISQPAERAIIAYLDD